MKEDVYHYTNAQGLLGIMERGVLWATHYKSLNDPQELQFGLKSVHELFNQQIRKVIQQRNVDLTDEEMRREAGIFASAFIDTYVGYGEPHVVSFSRHETDEEKHNGILSQWRAYGHDGGYAIGFDGRKLGAIVSSALKKHKFLFVSLQDVKYGKIEWSEKAKAVTKKYIEDYLDGADTGAIASSRDLILEIIPQVMASKDNAFREERESRILAGPLLRDDDFLGDRQKVVSSFRIRGGAVVPYIELFTDENLRSAIKELLVGPHPNQSRRVESLISLVRSQTCGDVPIKKCGIEIVNHF